MKCFEYNKQCEKSCEKNSCRYWIKKEKYQNCCLIASDTNNVAREEKFTLQDIGDIFKVTRMRICQIEKIAVKKLKDKFLNFE
jgi:DNA-directed RNA polymerase specialized sigma subunit